MILKLRDALGNEREVPAIRGTGVRGAAVENENGEYRLKLALTDGTVIDAGPLPAAVPAEEHTHGNLSYAGRLGTEAGRLIETGEGGALLAGRRLVTGTAAPEDVTGLTAGDIYIRIEA